MQMSKLLYEELSFTITGAAMEVHKILGPGYLEQVYEGALVHELNLRNACLERQKKLPVRYKEVEVGFYVADLVVEDKIIVELKAIAQLSRLHEAQAINYLATTGYRLALLINFGRRSLDYKRLVR